MMARAISLRIRALKAARDTIDKELSILLREQRGEPTPEISINGDELVPDPEVRRELGGVSEMTTWRWDRDPEMTKLGWPPPIKIRTRNYRSRRAVDEFLENRRRAAGQPITTRGR